MRYGIVFLPLLLAACAAFDNPPPEPVPEGPVASTPGGYLEHCFREPDSVFCP